MAANTQRTVTLTLDAQTRGTDDIKALAAEIRKLGASGAEASPEFESLARRLEQAGLAEEQQAKSAKSAAASLQSAKQSLLEARAAVSAYTAEVGGAKKANAEQAAELERLNQAVRNSKASMDAARAAVAAVTPEYERMKAATASAVQEAEQLKKAVSAPGEAAVESAKKAEGAFSGMAAKLRGLAGPIIAAFGAAEFFKANTGIEALRRSLELLKGSSEAAAKEIDYLKTTSNRLGLDVQEISKAYISLTAAAKGTAMEGQATRDIFEAVAGAMSKLGRSSADAEGALQAIAQMLSKGVVSMEEMRQQLGERLPGAMQAAADASGVTVSELTDMIGTGQVLASDLLPKLSAGLTKLYGTSAQTDGLASSWNRLKNSITETLQFIGDSGVSAAVTAVLGQLSIAVRGLVGAFDLLGKSIGITLGALVSFDFKHPIDSVNAWRTAIAGAAADIQTKLDKANNTTRETTTAQKALAEGSKVVSDSAKEQAVSWLAVVNAYAKVSKAAKETTDQAVKAAAAKEAEGKASTELAAAFGDETEKREANLIAALDNTTALKAVADARKAEAEIASSNAIALAESAKGEAVLSEEKRKSIQAATDSATAKKLEADQAAAVALSAQQHAAVLVVETAALQDNSGRVKELAADYETAKKALEGVRAARQSGNASMVDEQYAAIAAGQAAAIYRDALKDQTDVIASNARAKIGQLDVDKAGVRLAIEQQQTILQTSRARGDEYAAIQALNEIKRLEIKLAELTAQAKRAEADAALLTVKAKREELAASGQLTEAKEAELKAQEAGAKVKQVEAQIAGETAKRMKELSESYQQSGIAADRAAGSIAGVGDAARGSVPGVDALTGSLNQLNAAERAAADAAAGRTSPMDTSTFFTGGHQADRAVSSRDILYRSGATIDEARIAEKYFGELMQRKAQAGAAGVHSTDDNNRLIREASEYAAKESIRLARQELSTGQATDLGKPVADITQRALAQSTARPQDAKQISSAAAQEATNQPKTVVNVSIGGKTTPVNVASGSDATSLVNILKQLQTDSMRF